MYSFTYPEKPKDIVLLLTKIWGISVAGYCIAEQPETKCTGKYVNVFLHYTKYLNNSYMYSYVHHGFDYSV